MTMMEIYQNTTLVAGGTKKAKNRKKKSQMINPKLTATTKRANHVVPIGRRLTLRRANKWLNISFFLQV